MEKRLHRHLHFFERFVIPVKHAVHKARAARQTKGCACMNRHSPLLCVTRITGVTGG